MKGAAPPRATFRGVFAVREFRAVWLSEILSVAGDRLALVAVTLLVYDRTRSPLLTALAYASGYLPWIIGGLFLAGLADRYPRRAVMVTCDMARAVLVTAMVIPGLPVLGLAALLFAATAFAPPFDSSRAAITPAIVPGDLYPLAASVTQATFLAAQVAGVAVAGAAVEVTGVRPALAIDAVTFVLSGLLIGFGTRARPAAAAAGEPPRRGRGRGTAAGRSSANRGCGPWCCSAGWPSSTPSRRQSPPRTRPDSAEDPPRPAWCWRPPRSPR